MPATPFTPPEWEACSAHSLPKERFTTGQQPHPATPRPLLNISSPCWKPASINPSSFPPERNLLFRNDGNGTFTEVAAAAGVTDTTGRGLSAAWADFDGDGWLDLYVANDISENKLYLNRQGRFVDAGRLAATGSNRQPWDFIVVTEEPMICNFKVSGAWIEQANAVIVVVMDPGSRWWVEDAAAAVQNMLLACTALGYGACWIEGYTLRNEETFKTVLGIPENRRLFTLVSIGVPDEKPIKESLMLTDGKNYKKSAYGTVSYMPATFGAVCASVAIRDLMNM